VNKTEFLNALKNKISTLPQYEIDKFINYYSEILDDKIEDGMTEEEAVAGLEDVTKIAEKIMYEMPLPVLIKSRFNIDQTVITVLIIVFGFPIWFPLLMASLGILFGIYMAILGVIIACYAVVFGLGVGGIASTVASIYAFTLSPTTGLVALGGGLICIALSIFAVFPAMTVTKAMCKLTAWIGRQIKSIFIKKEKKV